MTNRFLRTLEDIREEQEALLERDLDPDMALLSDYLVGELTEAQAREVRARIEKDPDFRDLAEPLLVAYEHAPRIPRISPPDLQRKWLQLRERIGLPPIPGTRAMSDPAAEQFRIGVAKHKRRVKRIAIWSSAAMILFMFVPWGLLPLYRTLSHSQRTPYGVTQTLPLADGSRAIISGGTQLIPNPDFGDRNREVILTGEATFEVSKAGGVPFVVWTGAASITVTGTKFTVHAYEYEPSVITVTAGTVTVRGRDADGNSFGPVLTVGAGQRATVTRGFAPTLLAP